MDRFQFKYLFFSVLSIVLCSSHSFAQRKDSTGITSDSMRYPLYDRRGDRFTWKNKNSFDLPDTGIIKENIIYDAKTKQYFIEEKIGNTIYRKPTTLTFQEFYRLQSKKYEDDYFKQRSDAILELNKKVARPKTRVYNSLFDRIFGVSPQGLKVDIKPAGSVDMLLGYQGQYTNNPTIPENARSTGGLDFNMNTNLNVNASIGDKLKLPINYNTLANFDFANQIKLDYKGKDDEILKSFEAGNISFQSKGTLIPSAQNLFGVKTQLQFGRLTVTAALANQKSQMQNQRLQGGATLSNYQKRLDDYDENRNYLLGQYFVNNYNKTMSTLPAVNSQVQIQRVEVWITNKTGATSDTRNIVGFADLGEHDSISNTALVSPLGNTSFPDNYSNNLYTNAKADDVLNRNPSTVVGNLTGKGYKQVDDFEKVFARKLTPNEFYFNPQVGFLSINTQLQADDILAVAYQYTANGKVYQVGEFSQDVGLDSNQGISKVLFLKLLKATSARVKKPMWRLMMKNVYSLDMSNISREGFQFNVLYQQPSGGMNRYLPESSPSVSGKALIRVLKLDRLNSRNDPHPDGQFDYVEGFTIIAQQGKIIFPVLEPFGKDLDTLAFGGMPQATKNKYVFHQLYDSIKALAQTQTNLNRFIMQGQAKGSGGSDIYLGAFNIPQGSVKVMAGGQLLTEGVDYAIDYNLGSVKILNQAIINSNVPVNVGYENNASFGMQQRAFTGLRMDYLASKKLSIGATYESLSERPFFSKVGVGDDPISNSIYGVDFSYKSSLPGLTRALNKLPFYSTKAPSSIAAYGEGAYFKPGHPSQIGSGSSGLIYVDDFESTTSSLDMRFPLVSWALASTPAGSFNEASLNNDLEYGKNRSRLSWYNIEPNLQDQLSSSNPLKGNLKELSDPRVRRIYTNELFPQQTTNITNTQTTTFDMAYYPKEPGPYNYTTSGFDQNGHFITPKDKWGGIMRSIDQTDFETNNFAYIEFWVQDPFIKGGATGGQLRINLGEVSEDILKDGKRFYENGLSTPTAPATVDNSVWGEQPINPIQVTNAFSNNATDRPYQDVGFDGIDDDSEKVKFNNYVATIDNTMPLTSTLRKMVDTDPSKDDYVWYRDAAYDNNKTGILGRYKYYSNAQGNSPIAGSSTYSPAATLYPDNEDLNRDNTLNQVESYYEYNVDLTPDMSPSSTNYITDKRVVRVKYADGTTGNENWYLFRVPIRKPTSVYGNIQDFKSIRFMRMYLTGFDDSVVLRFASLNLVRDQWRQFNYQIDSLPNYDPIVNTATTFNVLAVNLEENSNRTPVKYVIPCGIDRVQLLSTNGVNLLQNEQSMSLQVKNLEAHDARGVIKTVSLDMRSYGKLSMFAHIENMINSGGTIQNNDVNLIMRIGQDYQTNYYEIKVPMKVTPQGATDCATIWPDDNSIDFNLQDLIQLKLRRNNKQSFDKIYRELVGTKTFSVMGNPNIGQVNGLMIAVENTKSFPIDAEVWVDELRLSEINEEGSYAALAKVDLTLADLGRVTVSGNMYTQGWGTIDSKINDRQKDNMRQFDAAINIDAGKLLPKSARLSIPIYASITNTVHAPQFDPYDLDVRLQSKLDAAKNQAMRDSINDVALEQTTIKTINLTNVKVMPKGKPHLWSLSNLDLSVSYTQTVETSPVILTNDIEKWRGGLGYTYNRSSKYIEPFKKLIKSKSKWFSLVKDFNFNLTPSLLSFRSDVNRQYAMYIPRVVNTDLTQSKVSTVDTTFDKYFTFDRFYNMRWDLTKAINVDFTATNNARVDEPDGALDTKAKKDTVRDNFFKGGRTTMYQQKANISYNFPLSKLPLTDWITARYTYGTSYNWIAASQVNLELGNALENSQSNVLNGEFDFSRLYLKSKWLKALNTPSATSNAANTNKQNNKMQDDKGGKNIKNGKGGKGTDAKTDIAPAINNSNNTATVTIPEVPSKEEFVGDLTGVKRTEAIKKWKKLKKDRRIALRLQRQNRPIELNTVERTFGNVLTSLKRVSLNYSENFRSRIPGWKDSTQILGQNWRSMQPGMDYVFGRQPDTTWLNDKAKAGVIKGDSLFNVLYTQNYEQKLSINAQFEPIKELTITLTFDKSFSKNYSELFKDTSIGGNGQLRHLNPTASGGFSVSFISFETLFEDHNPNKISNTFHTFENNRVIISKRLAAANPYWDKTYGTDGFATGYGRYSQSVVVPAFLAAYTGKDASSIALLKETSGSMRNNPFSGYLPKPNWRVTYTGLSKIPALAKIFTSINLSHAYSGTLSMNSFTSALNYADPFGYHAPGFTDPISNNYIPFYLVPNINIQESFSPLIGIDVTTVNQLNFKFEYKKSRTMALSLVDYQLTETNSSEWTIGAGWRKKGFPLPFKLPGSGAANGKKLQNDITFRLDLSFRDDANSNSTLDQANAYGTGGQQVITIQPSIDYVLNNRINLKLYFDQRRTTPYISTSSPTVMTRAGLQIRVSLSPK